MKNKILTIILAIVAVIVIGVGAFFVIRGFNAQGDGKITIEVIALDESTIKSKEISYKDGDNLKTLIEDNFENVLFDGTLLMNIESLVTPNDWSTYICVYQNNEMSAFGISEIIFKSGDVITLKMVVNSYA